MPSFPLPLFHTNMALRFVPICVLELEDLTSLEANILNGSVETAQLE